MTERITDTLICIIGCGVFFGICGLAELLGDWLAESAPDWIWMLLFITLLAGFVVWLGRWLMDAGEREARNKEGKDGNRKEAYPTDRR